jgi:peroxisomal enoyl-CoA hydratase 2
MSERSETYFEDLEEGDDGPEYRVEDLTRTMFVKYAGASGDFNPMHHDDTVATKVGYPSVFGHGMFSAGVLSHYLTDWLGVGNLRAYGVRFKGQVYPGDTLRFGAKVTRKYKEEDEARVDCQLSVTNQKDEVVLTGTATAALPSRG